MQQAHAHNKTDADTTFASQVRLIVQGRGVRELLHEHDSLTKGASKNIVILADIVHFPR